MPPFLPFMPNVDTHLQAFKEAVWQMPSGGSEAVIQAYNHNPQLPETAGIDHTPLQLGALQALVGIRNSEEEMRLAALQANAIARSSKIAAARAYEALLSYQRIMSRETIAAEKAASAGGGMVPGPKTLFLEIPLRRKLRSSLLQTRITSFLDNTYKNGDVEQGLASDTKTQRQVVNGVKTWKDREPKEEEGGLNVKGSKRKSKIKRSKGKRGGIGGGQGLGGLGGGGDEEEFDVDSKWYLKNDLEKTFDFCKQVSIMAAQSAKDVTEMFQKTRSASRAVTEALKLPGAPVPPPFPTTMLKPPRRPRDLPPSWLDVPFGISKGADPYVTPTGFGRAATNSKLRGVGGFNPFEGTGPMPEDGVGRIYRDIGYKADGKRLDPGIFFDEKEEKGLFDTLKDTFKEMGEKQANAAVEKAAA
jgi:hypothetical protein